MLSVNTLDFLSILWTHLQPCPISWDYPFNIKSLSFLLILTDFKQTGLKTQCEYHFKFLTNSQNQKFVIFVICMNGNGYYCLNPPATRMTNPPLPLCKQCYHSFTHSNQRRHCSYLELQFYNRNLQYALYNKKVHQTDNIINLARQLNF
jgi:hypothetical protein